MKKTSLIVIGIAVIILIAIFAFGKNTKTEPEKSVVTGTVAYRERISLPVNSVITVTLNDISKADAPAEKISEQIINPEPMQQVPFTFELPYNTETIIDTSTYSVSAKITVNEKTWWQTDTVVPVITDTSATMSDINLILKRVPDNYSEPVAIPTAKLEGTMFTLISYNGIPASENNTVLFQNGTVSAKFCNTLNGEYTQEGYVLNSPNMISTMMFCESPEYLMQAESAFAKIFASGANMTLSENTLILENGSDRFIYRIK
jgi:putative lipoprotein